MKIFDYSSLQIIKAENTLLLPLIASCLALLITLISTNYAAVLLMPILSLVYYFFIKLGCYRRSRFLAYFFLSFFSSGAYWVFFPLHFYTGSFIAASFLSVTLYFTLTMQMMICFYIMPWGKCNHCYFPLLFSFAWLLGETVRSVFLGGFPWLLLGYSVVNTPWLQLAPYLGVYGLSWLLLLCSSYFTFFIVSKKKKGVLILLLVTLLISIFCYINNINYTYPLNMNTRVGLVQGNFNYKDKWSNQNWGKIFTRYFTMSQNKEVDTIIWPESSLIMHKSNDLNNKIIGVFSKLPTQSLISGTIFIEDSAFKSIYNTAMIYKRNTSQLNFYKKSKLVPFAEYLPGNNPFFDWIKQKVLNFPMSNLRMGDIEHTANLDSGKSIISPIICYEIAYTDLVYMAAANSNIITVLTDDSYFLNSIATLQHLQITQFRAAELQKPILFVNSIGNTSVINFKGNILANIPYNKAAILYANVRGRKGRTPIHDLYLRMRAYL
jgi:apolipoprotein N-acyltransferase